MDLVSSENKHNMAAGACFHTSTNIHVSACLKTSTTWMLVSSENEH